MRPGQVRPNRRGFLHASLSLLAWPACSSLLADDRPPVTRPRATSGDAAVEPNWDERLTITVGPAKADLTGTTEKVLQAAVDYVARLGGGTVRVLPGTYRLRNAVYLRSQVRILGSGADSILIKEPSVATKLAEDSDWYDQEITLDDATGFQVGDGVCLRTKNPHNGGVNVAKRTLVARSGNRFKLDRALRENFWVMGEAKASTLFPILSGDEISDVVIENITLDGNKDNNENLDGNYAGCIFLQDCSRFTDNLIRDNDVLRSGKVGVLFRPERGKAFAPHRNRLESNRITDSGGQDGIAVDVQGQTESVTIAKNSIRETRDPMARIGVRVGAETRDVKLVENQIEGFAVAVQEMPKL